MKDVEPKARFNIRMERSKPILDAYLAWLKQQRSRTLPKSLLGQAIAYSLNKWDKLIAFLKDGRLEIDNNRSESKCQYLQRDRDRKRKRFEPFPIRYLMYLFEQLPQLPDPTDPAALDSLLPWSPTLPMACRVLKS